MNSYYKTDRGSLYNGDCLEGMKEIPDKSIDMILCDLPYGTTACKWDVVIPFDKLWEQYNRIIKDNSVIALFGTEPFSSALRMSNIKNYKYDWFWEKEKGTGFQFAKNQPLRKIENICIFAKKKCKYNPIMVQLEKPYKHTLPINKSDVINKGFKSMDVGDKNNRIYKEYTHSYPTNILKFARDNSKFHPTQKPIALFEYLIKTYTNEEALILDNCLGSGTTAIASLRTGRFFIGFELNKGYYDIAVNRVREELSKIV